MRQELVDYDVARRLGRDDIKTAGRATDGVTGSPCLAIGLAIGWPRQDQRVPAAIRLDGPGIIAVKTNVLEDGTRPVVQPDQAGIIIEGVADVRCDVCYVPDDVC